MKQVETKPLTRDEAHVMAYDGRDLAELGRLTVDGMKSGWREGVGWMKQDNWKDKEAVCVDGGKGGRWSQWEEETEVE